MYYPKQIPYLLDKDFQKEIEYKEYHIKELEDYCMCIWTMKSKNTVRKSILNNILPDACIDMVIDFENREISFAGFSRETEPFELNNTVNYMGVRLRPGAFYSLFQISADKIMDHTISFYEVEKKYNLTQVLSFTDTVEQLELLKEYMLEKIRKIPNNNFIVLVNQLYQNPKEQSIIDIAQNIGYNKRHVLRLFKKNYGVTPKVLLNILRLHLCLTLLLENDTDLIDIANFCGFYDQSHFIKEIKRYTGISPLNLLESYR